MPEYMIVQVHVTHGMHTPTFLDGEGLMGVGCVMEHCVEWVEIWFGDMRMQWEKEGL